MGWNRSWAPYVSVAKRRSQSAREIAALDKSNKGKGKSRSPVLIANRKIATTFWGEAWCKNLESYSDYENRLPRGRSYCRNGSILDLQISKGQIEALVSGSSFYKIKISIKSLQPKTWNSIKSDCSQSIHSMMDLLRGKLTNAVMQRLTQAKVGLFPEPKEIDFKCSCPDSAYLCKHLAAVMYGIGNRLDSSPELLFVLRGVEQSELISEIAIGETINATLSGKPADDENGLTDDDLGSLFGIDLVAKSVGPKKPTAKKLTAKKLTAKESTVKKPTAKKVQVNESKTAVADALKRATKGKTGSVGRNSKAISSVESKTSNRIKPRATTLATSSSVRSKTVPSKTKANPDKPIRPAGPKKPSTQPTAPRNGLPESVRKAMEYLEQNPVPSPASAARKVTATKKKNMPANKPR